MNKHQIYQHQGLGGTSGIGLRCGLVLVDFVNGFVDIDQLGGPHIEQAANASQVLLEVFRQRSLPIVHTRVVFEADGSNHNVFALRVKPLQKLLEHAPASQTVPQLAPRTGEWVIRKQSASAFLKPVWPAGCTSAGSIRRSSSAAPPAAACALRWLTPCNIISG